MADNSADVIIIGAGAAGLAAASELSAQGKTVILLEGRSRIGGRIDTVHDPAWTLPIERGAEFIHGKPKEITDILHASGCLAYDIADTHHIYAAGRLRKRDDFFAQVEKILALAGRPKTDISFADTLKKFAAHYKPEHKAWARSFVEGFDAADVTEVSSRWLQHANEASAAIEGDRLARIYAGYDRMTNFLRTGIPDAGHRIELSATVTRIDWSRPRIEVTATRPAAEPLIFTAAHVLITVPVSILQLAPGETGHISFDPPLPPKKRAAIHLLRAGPVVKVLLRCRDPLWEKVHPDLNFFHAPGAAFPTWWTSLPIRTTILTGWAGGPAAARLAGNSTDAILTEAVTTLSRLLKLPARKLKDQVTAAHVCDWQSEPLSRGAYSYATVGGATAALDLAKPLAAKLFFAGEATHPGLTGTVPAALASAHRASKEILRHKQ